MADVIKICNAKKQFDDACALDDVSISFEKGKIHGIIGRNGSGKTVLFKCICGLMSLSYGKIFVNNEIIGKDLHAPNGIGAIIEAPGFLPNYSGYGNLKILSHIAGNKGKTDITKAMQTVGLDPKSKKWVSKYSLGMRQRLGLAQAIMDNPDILILDEPMNGLDNKGVEQIRNLLISYKKLGKTILLASHNKEDIVIMCDTVIEMDQGRIINISVNGVMDV